MISRVPRGDRLGFTHVMKYLVPQLDVMCSCRSTQLLMVAHITLKKIRCFCRKLKQLGRGDSVWKTSIK